MTHNSINSETLHGTWTVYRNKFHGDEFKEVHDFQYGLGSIKYYYGDILTVIKKNRYPYGPLVYVQINKEGFNPLPFYRTNTF